MIVYFNFLLNLLKWALYPENLDSVTDTTGVIATNGSYYLRADNAYILLSNDGGQSYPNSILFAESINEVLGGYVFSNGSVLVYTTSSMYGSSDNLASLNVLPLIDSDDSQYSQHSPVNSSYPGEYFTMLNVPNVEVVDGKEMIIWGNYGNVFYGAVPTVVWYCFDDVTQLKIAYKFGQNPRFRDDGTATGGTTGNLLGDSENTIIARHGHSSQYCNFNSKWYFCSGDIDVGYGLECHWFSGEYNNITDTWSWVLEISVDYDDRFKSTGIQFDGSILYFGSDQTADTNVSENGVFKCDISDFTNKSTHTRIFDFNGEYREVVDMYFDKTTETIITVLFGTDGNVVWFIRSDGSETKQYDFTVTNQHVRLFKKDVNGYFKSNIKYTKKGQSNQLFFKP